MTHKHTIKEIASDTGLTVNFIRRIVNKSKIVKKQYSKRSTSNELLFDDNGFVYFREAARLKSDNYTLSDIIDRLDQSISKADNVLDNPPVKPSDPMFDRVLASHDEIIKAKDETLQVQRELINQLESKILLLTEGKSPEQVKIERELLNQEHLKLELERKEIERIKKELEDQKQAEQAKRQVLIDELARLSWFQFGRKADLIRQLRELS